MENKKSIKSSLSLNPILKNKTVAWLLLGISFLLMLIENFLKMDYLVGGWNIVSYLLVLVPLVYMLRNKELENPYTKWFIPFLLILIIDMFVYSNQMVQYILPIIFYLFLGVLYLTSMHKVHSLYQTLIPKSIMSLLFSWKYLIYIQIFLENLFLKSEDKKLYARIGLALLITLPFLALFIALLFSADAHFKTLLTDAFSFKFNFSLHYFLTVPLYFVAYLLFCLYAFSNHKERHHLIENKSLDMLIVAIFLGMINLLFMLFVALQLPFLFGGTFLQEGTSLASFAREGFFQLMMVMGIVLLIFFFIMRRFKGEKISIVLLSLLLVQTIIMGTVSLKKMYIYQSIKGATVLRYYVEWFDYFLILVLALGIFFLVKKLKFSKLLNIVSILGVLSFTLIMSLNIDAMVASHNIEKFKSTPEQLDRYALRYLSIDALPIIKTSNIFDGDTNRYKYSKTLHGGWHREYMKRACNSFSSYHYGYCSILNQYGENNESN